MGWYVLAPYISTCPIGIIPIIFLDSFKVHLLGSVADGIQSLGVELKFITPGCKGLIKPINVGFNKLCKAVMSRIYTNFMMEQDPNAPLCGATRLDVSGWILKAVGSIRKETMINP
jgi:hypothetical protein